MADVPKRHKKKKEKKGKKKKKHPRDIPLQPIHPKVLFISLSSFMIISCVVLFLITATIWWLTWWLWFRFGWLWSNTTSTCRWRLWWFRRFWWWLLCCPGIIITCSFLTHIITVCSSRGNWSHHPWSKACRSSASTTTTTTTYRASKEGSYCCAIRFFNDFVPHHHQEEVVKVYEAPDLLPPKVARRKYPHRYANMYAWQDREASKSIEIFRFFAVMNLNKKTILDTLWLTNWGHLGAKSNHLQSESKSFLWSIE